jgi:hypothetical protein
MKSALYLSLASPLLIFAGCSLDESGDAPGPGSGGTQASGGTTNTAGTTPTNTAGTTPTFGGMGTTGGTTGTTAGTMGMTAGTMGMTAGTMGMTAGSGQGGSGGSGTGGTSLAGSGGKGGGNMGGMSGGGGGGTTATGGASTAGSAGMAGGASDVPTPATLAPGLDGHLITTPCGDQPMQDDCAGAGWKSNAVDNFANHACMGGRLEANIPFKVGGTPGTTYDVTMHFYGIMEPRQYANVMREATGDPNLNGGTPTPWAEAPAGTTITGAGDQNYNTYEIHVYNQNNQEVRAYFLNADNGTGHYTMLIDYEKTIKVIGGGEVRLRVFDGNCRMIKNCGAQGSPGGAACANQARSVNISAASPAPPAAQLTQPGLGQAPAHSGQWWLIDVTKVAVAP